MINALRHTACVAEGISFVERAEVLVYDIRVLSDIFRKRKVMERETEECV